jgi:hypothetical protein
VPAWGGGTFHLKTKTKFRSEDEFPSEDKFPNKEEDEDTSPEDESPGKAEFPSEDEDIFSEDALPSEDKDEKTLSPKTRCCCKGRGALLRRERGGIERRGEVLYNERANAVMRRETATKVEAVQGKRRHNVLSVAMCRQC